MRTPMLATAAVLLLAAAGCTDEDSAPTSPTAPSAAAAALPAAPVAALAFWQISAGGLHTCAVTTDFVPYCWGWNASGELGVGTTTGPDACPNGSAPQPCSMKPVAVLGGHRFRQVSGGTYHTCAVTTDYHAWCWGDGLHGGLGNGTQGGVSTPVAVAGGVRFRQVSAGFDFTCGLSYPDNKAWCWGYNNRGQLGDGTLTNRLTPVKVLGGLTLAVLSAGASHACAVTDDDRAFCWGYNGMGQLGDSTTIGKRTRPKAVSGGHRFRYIAAGASHTCAVNTADRAFCWGANNTGQLGNGKTALSRWPRAVSGGISVRRVRAGSVHTCAEGTDSRAWCWGNNSEGELGTGGTPNPALTPVAVAGGLRFAQLDVSISPHTCAKTSSGVGYCWGTNMFAELGNGTSGGSRTTPVPVAGPM